MAELTAVMLCCLALPSQLPAAAEPIDVVVVCPDTLHAALEPWLEYRQQQGYRVQLMPPGPRLEVRQGIRNAFENRRQGREGYVLLVGEVPTQRDDYQGGIPTWYLPAEVTRRWSSEPWLASDLPYADLDDDGIPELAVGRLPAANASQLKQMVAKTLAFEQEQDFGLWRREIRVVAGTGGFGPLIDGAIEQVAGQFLTHRVPPGYATDLTFADWRSPYCPDLFTLREHTVQGLGEGGLAWIYMGHGRPDRLETMAPELGQTISLLTNLDAQRLTAAPGRPIAFFLSCYTAAMDGAEESLAESLIRSPGGPVAVIGGTRLTMPYGMAVLGTELLHQWFHHRNATLGQLVKAAKRGMLDACDGPRSSLWLDAVAWPLHPQRTKLEQERREHVHMFHLLGDPLLRLHHPKTVSLDAAPVLRPGTPTQIRGDTPVAGKAIVELVCPRDQFTFETARRTQWLRDDQSRQAMSQLQRQANDRRWNVAHLDVSAGEFTVWLDVPPQAKGAAFARVFVQGSDDCAMGWTAVQIEAADSQPVGRLQEVPLPLTRQTTMPSR